MWSTVAQQAYVQHAQTWASSGRKAPVNTATKRATGSAIDSGPIADGDEPEYFISGEQRWGVQCGGAEHQIREVDHSDEYEEEQVEVAAGAATTPAVWEWLSQHAAAAV